MCWNSELLFNRFWRIFSGAKLLCASSHASQNNRNLTTYTGDKLSDVTHYWRSWMKNLGLMRHVKTETHLLLQYRHKFRRSKRPCKALQSIPRASIHTPSPYILGRECLRYLYMAMGLLPDINLINTIGRAKNSFVGPTGCFSK